MRKVHWQLQVGSARSAVTCSGGTVRETGRRDPSESRRRCGTSPGADVGRVLARSVYSTTSVHMESTESSRDSACAERGAGGRKCLRWVGPYSHSIPSSGNGARPGHISARIGLTPATGTERSLSPPPGCSRISSCATASRTPLRTITFHAWWFQRQRIGTAACDIQHASCHANPRHAAQRACGSAAVVSTLVPLLPPARSSTPAT
jgi:hypothetical protein